MHREILRFIAVIGILGFVFLSLGSLSFAKAAIFNNVEISIQTSGMQANYFVVDAFNMSGYLEASVQTHYSAASFELPNGQYIFTVTANNESYSVYNPVPLLSPSSGGASSSSVSSLPIYVAPAEEYGFSVTQVSNSMTITITTHVSQYPTNPFTVKVLYANGTAAVGASVSVSVIGSSYYWGYEPNVVTWASTGDDGIAALSTPIAPVQINAWIWVPSNTTGSPSPKIGAPGQVVNGTVIAVPTYIGLAGSAVGVPPQTSVIISLQTQQTNYWITPYAATASSGATSGYVAGPGSVPSSVYAQQQGSPDLQGFQAPSSTASPQPTASPTPSGGIGGESVFLLILVFVAVVIALIVVGLVITSKRKKPSA